jgi:hypothetical protein
MSRLLIGLGLGLLATGLLLHFVPNAASWLGKLPGDVSYRGERYEVHFPIVTCIVVSVALTAVMWVIRRLGG